MSADARRAVPGAAGPGGGSEGADINVGHMHELAGFIRASGSHVGEALQHLNRAREEAAAAFEARAARGGEASFGGAGGTRGGLYDTVGPVSVGTTHPNATAQPGSTAQPGVESVPMNPDPERQLRRAHDAAREFFHSWMPGLRRLRDRDEVLAGHTIAFGSSYEKVDRAVASSTEFDLSAPPSGAGQGIGGQGGSGYGAGPR